MKRRKPEAPPREDYTLVEFRDSRISPMRDLIVCCTPASTVLRGRLLDRFAQWWDRKTIAVDLIALVNQVATLEIRVNSVLVATASATSLAINNDGHGVCPRCGQHSTYELLASPTHLLVMAACRRCDWRSSAAEYDLGRTA